QSRGSPQLQGCGTFQSCGGFPWTSPTSSSPLESFFPPQIILGLLILSVGIYAEVERQRHRTLEGIFLAPAVLLLLLGISVFLVSFVGMLGSLRDNRTLLRMFFWVLLLIFLTELLLILMEIIFENKMNEVFHSNIQEGIRHYYDDLDFKNILDFVQEKFSCCGGDEFRDWEVNRYHWCNGSGALVPGGVVNTLCGYRALDKERLELLGTIHVRGCIHAVGLWLKDNFQATLAIVCSLLLPQVRAGSPGIFSPIPGILSWEDPPRIRDEPPVLGFSAPSRLAGSEGSAPFPVLEGGK
uniref:Tetraspanin n=1 Tax=Zosterops lateralis melanops TaxID=1220523 RepID=A0A8D2PQ15_ZOSLA